MTAIGRPPTVITAPANPFIRAGRTSAAGTPRACLATATAPRDTAEPAGHLAPKAKRNVAGCGPPWTTLRATQFHDALLTVAAQMAKLPVLLVPVGFRFQPVDTGEVAARLVELALGTPAGLVPHLAGPRVYEMAALVRGYLRASHRRQRPSMPLWMPGKAARAFRAGANVAPDRAVGRLAWEEFLAAWMSAPRDSSSGLP